ncbi:MAG: hypothetical protein ABJA66_02940 [Actinomycetota bacterium]
MSFNIFEENLEEIVYAENSVSETENNDANKKTVVVIGEVTVPKIAALNYDTFIYRRFAWERDGTLNVL